MKRLQLIAAACCVLLLMAGCGQPEQDADARARQMEQMAAERGIDIDVSIDTASGEEQVVIDRSVGGMQATVGKNLDLPAGFPDDVPVMPGVAIHAANETPVGFMVQGSTDQSAAQIAAFYAAELPKLGWEPAEPQPAVGPMSRIGFTKANRVASVMVIESDESPSTLQLSVVSTP
jgi:hypothetical protein